MANNSNRKWAQSEPPKEDVEKTISDVVTEEQNMTMQQSEPPKEDVGIQSKKQKPVKTYSLGGSIMVEEY